MSKSEEKHHEKKIVSKRKKEKSEQAENGDALIRAIQKNCRTEKEDEKQKN